MKTVDEKWKEKIKQELYLGEYDEMEETVGKAIDKAEQHFKDLMPHESYVRRQVERERQEIAKAIFDELDNMFSRCAYGTEKGIITRMSLIRYEKIKKKWIAKPSLDIIEATPENISRILREEEKDK